MSDKFILDACCGGKHFWFDKTHPNAIYMDIRSVEKGTIKVQPNWSCDPDVIASYTEMPFDDDSFNLVVWDIPHKLKFDTGLITTKYGSLGNTWREDCKKGFDEIMRVLKPNGVLNFKFNDLDISVKEMLELFPIKPLFGTKTKKGVNNTYWFCFMKIL